MEEVKNTRKPWRVAKRICALIGTVLILIIIFKFSMYFMPFFIAGLLAVLIEPIIKFCMNKLNWSRRVSSSIIISLTIILFVSLIIFGGISLVNWIIKFSKDIGPIISNISTIFEEELLNISNKLSNYMSKEVTDTIVGSITSFLSNAGNYIQEWMAKVLQLLLSVPTMLLNIIVTILALIFFTKDKIYILDSIEHHVPKKWIKNVSEILKQIFTTLGEYIKVYGKILMVTFAELFFAFAILKSIGFELKNIALLSFIIALVDILPVLGIGTILIPWIIWQFVIGNIKFGFALSVVYFIIWLIRQLIEPKLVSKQLGVHPLTTLFAMYAGFKYFGFIGLIIGPVILMILKCIFAKPMEKGFFKDLFDFGT